MRNCYDFGSHWRRQQQQQRSRRQRRQWRQPGKRIANWLGHQRTDVMWLPLVLVWFDLGPRTGITGNGLWSDQLAVFAPHCRPLSWRATFVEPHRTICGCHSAAALMLAYFCRLANASTSCGRSPIFDVRNAFHAGGHPN